MPIRKQSVAMQFGGGVSTKTDAKQVPATQLLDLQNATFVRDTTLAKRNGYAALGTQVDAALATYTNARGLGERDGELVLFTEGQSYSHRPSSGTWSAVGDVASVNVTTKPIARSGTVQTCPDAATNHGVTALAWEDSRGGIWASVVEADTQRVLLPAMALTSVSNGSMVNVRCVTVQDNIAILYADRTNGIIYIAMVNPANPEATLVPSRLTDDLDVTNPTFDACPVGVNGDVGLNEAVIAWAVAGGYRIGNIAPSGVIGSPVTGYYSSQINTDHALTGPLSVSVDRRFPTVAAVAICTATVLVVVFHWSYSAWFVLRTATTTQSTTTAVRIASGWGGSDGLLGYGAFSDPLFWWALDASDDTTTDTHAVVVGSLYVNSAARDSATPSYLLGHCLASRAFHDGPAGGVSSWTPAQFASPTTTTTTDIAGDCYVAVVHAVQFFPWVGIVRMSAVTGFGKDAHTTCVARLLPGESTGNLSRTSTGSYESSSMLPSVTDVGQDATSVDASRVHSIPLGYRIQLASSNGDQFSEAGIKLASLDFDAAASYQTAQLGRGLYLAGACPSHYDGAAWAEAGIHVAPDVGYNPDGTVVDITSGWTIASGSMATGTYLYKVWYEHVDAQGELHVGPTRSITYAVTFESTRKVTLVIPTYRLTSRDRVRICVARSAVNQTGTDVSIPCYRVTGTDPSVQTGSNCYLENDPTVDAIGFTDNLVDIDLLKREPLYTNGGTLANDPSPWSGSAIATGKGRLFWTDPTDPNMVRFSQERRDDTGLEAPNPLSLLVPPYGGAIIGLGILDDALIILKQTAIYIVGGPGPDDDGGFTSQNAFSPAALVTSDVGCVSPQSVAQTPEGIVFQTSKGVYLLGRDRSVKSIGDPVYAYKDQTITRATLLPDRHQVLFLTDTAEGRTLLWDYERNQWSTYTNHLGLDGAVVGGTFYYLRPDGRVFAETPGVYVDDNSHIPMVIETAWIKFAGFLQGWQKVISAMFIGRWVSSHTLRMRFRIDYNEGYSTPIDVTPDANQTGSQYGDGNYGDGPYGGAGGDTTRYQTRFHINRRCQAISFRLEDVEATDTYGAAYELSELLLTGGVIGPSFVPGAGRQA